MKGTTMGTTMNTLDRDFDHHPPPTDEVASLHGEVRVRCKELAAYLERNIPGCREHSIARRKIEEAMMWANAAIARQMSAGPRAAMTSPIDGEETFQVDAMQTRRARPEDPH